VVVVDLFNRVHGLELSAVIVVWLLSSPWPSQPTVKCLGVCSKGGPSTAESPQCSLRHGIELLATPQKKVHCRWRKVASRSIRTNRTRWAERRREVLRDTISGLSCLS
jgi:hypothetical protein